MNSSLKLQISIDRQVLRVLENGEITREYRVSTAAKGIGFAEGSNRTPTGRFRIAEKIGENLPSGTSFVGRQVAGEWDGESKEGDLILSRILWLDGLDAENANTKDRYIYIHGTHREDLLGQPASHGCVRLANQDVIELFDLVEVGTEVEILPPTRKQGMLLFIDCDSTLSSIEGIDELAHSRGEEVYVQVVELTHQAMNGEVPISEVFPRRMELIRPDRSVCDAIAQAYIEQMVEGVDDLLDEARERGWQPVILSGGFAPLIEPLAAKLGIEHVEAVPIQFDSQGDYVDYGREYPTTRNHGKNEIIREWKQALLPETVVMVGDGVSDLETQEDVDLFVGFGGVVARDKVREGCDLWLADMKQREAFWKALDSL
ncbi:MAG: HAD-IB family phosphatase [Akkermansiaceae bacterium]|nr:HAD-IB family phosphatase [Akkermansiaceae bacterium]